MKAAEIRSLTGSHSWARRRQSVISLLLCYCPSLSMCQHGSFRCLGDVMRCLVPSALSCFKQSNRGVSSVATVWQELCPEGAAPAHSHLADKALMHVARCGHRAFWPCHAGAKPACDLFICTVLKIITLYLMCIPCSGGFSFHLCRWHW